jgi:hypothetical protein
MAFDTKQWLTELGFNETEIGELAPKFESRTAQLEKGQLRQAEFSRNQDALKKEQEKLVGQQQRLEQDIAEWATLTATEKEAAKKLRG